MDYEKIVRRVVLVGLAIGSSFLITIMLLTVADVISRTLWGAISGTYELVELFIVVAVSFAMAYTAHEKGHVIVEIVVSRFSKRAQVFVKAFVSIICLVTWGLIVWASIGILPERVQLSERTPLLEVSYIPFRGLWTIGLIILCVVFLVDIYIALSKAVRK